MLVRGSMRRWSDVEECRSCARPRLRLRQFSVLVHVSVLLLRYGSDTASTWGDWIDTIGPLVAAVVCWRVSRLSGPFGKRVWQLTSLSALLTASSQALYTEYYDYLHAPLGTLWPSDLLVFFWAVPVVMTLFLSPRDPDGQHQWLRVCDFAQVCTLVLALELSQIYVPSRWQAAGQAMEIRTAHAAIFFFGLIALSFIVRSLLAANRVERSFFGRLGSYLISMPLWSREPSTIRLRDITSRENGPTCRGRSCTHHSFFCRGRGINARKRTGKKASRSPAACNFWRSSLRC